MGLSRDIIRGAFTVLGVAFSGALLNGNPGLASWVSATFFSGQPLGFYQFAVIFSIVGFSAYIFSSILATSIAHEEDE